MTKTKAGPASARKPKNEGAQVRNRRLVEYTSNNFNANLSNLQTFDPKIAAFAQATSTMIGQAQIDDAEKGGLANVLSNFAAMAAQANVWTDPDAKLRMSLQSARVNTNDAAITPIVTQLSKLAHRISMKHESMNESQKTKKKDKVVKESLSFLIENELERAEVVLAAKGITQKLQDIAENLSKLEANDIMPMLDSFRTTFGPQAADQFSQVATAKIRELIGAVQTSKSAIDTEISRLEQMVNGGDGSDAAMDANLPPADLGAAPPADATAGAPSDELGAVPGAAPAEGPPGELPPDVAPPDGATGFAGRARKESATNKGRKLTEFLDATAAHTGNAADSPDFKANLDKLAAISPKCFTFAHDIADSIHDLAVSGEIRNKLMHALGHIVAMASSEEVWSDPAAIADMGVSTHFVDGSLAEVVNAPEVRGIVKNMHHLAHMLAIKHGGGLSEDDVNPPSATLPVPPIAAPLAAAPVSPLAAPAPLKPSPLMAGRVYENRSRAKNVRRLKEARNPDKMILTVFRNVFRECRNVTQAATGTARAFGIDVGDVVTIVREAKSKIREDAVPALMGVEMGQPDPDTNPALMGQNPTAANPQPGKPNQPMTPADMRANKQALAAQDKAAAASGQPNQPITPPKQAAPVQQVAGQQKMQPVMTPQMQQQLRANQANKLPAMPGKVVNSPSNMRTI